MSKLITVQMGRGAGLLGLQLEKVPNIGDEITVTNINFVDMEHSVLRRQDLLGLTLRITGICVDNGKTWYTYVQVH